MNLTMIDVTEIKRVKAGDKVILIGKSRSQQITANDLAQWAQTINYEIVTRINPIIPRVLK
jgi:alanine racemase